MQVNDASLRLTAEHRQLSLEARQQRFEPRSEARRSAGGTATEQIELSARAQALAATPQEAAGAAGSGEVAGGSGDSRLTLLVQLIEWLTGRPVRVFDVSELQSADASAPTDAATAAASDASAAQPPPTQQTTLLREEYEATYLRAEGVVRSADGTTFSFSLELHLSRYYREVIQTERSSGANRRDPLVLNFNGQGAALRDQRFRFDLDGDGNSEWLPQLARGNGFLVFDRNGNGRVDGGRELFGPARGDGFAELAELDQDGNGWIDSADAAFEQLRLWLPDDDGGGGLQRLDAAGVAALATRSIAAPFALRGEGNSDLGQLRSSSVYLSVQHGAGWLQQVDLSV